MSSEARPSQSHAMPRRQAISQLRAAASHANDDVGIVTSSGAASIANADANAIVLGRTPAQVPLTLTLTVSALRIYHVARWSKSLTRKWLSAEPVRVTARAHKSTQQGGLLSDVLRVSRTSEGTAMVANYTQPPRGCRLSAWRPWAARRAWEASS